MLNFLLQYSLFVSQQPTLYPTEESHISFVCSLSTDRTLEWATAIWNEGRPTFTTFNSFLQRFREIFEHPEGDKEAGEQLLALRQGKRTAADYALSFRTPAAQTGWVDDTLKWLFRKGLNMDLQSELACRDEGRNLDQFIDLAIRIDNLIRSRLQTRDPSTLSAVLPATTSDSEPMQIGLARLSPEEREHCVR